MKGGKRDFGLRTSGFRSAVVFALVVIGVSAKGDPPRKAAVGFDHVIHARDVDVAGGAAIPCTRCHALKHGLLVGRPGHAACFGACHGAAPVAPHRGARLALDADREKLCTNCHAEAELAAPYTGRLAVPYPPYAIERDFTIAFGHQTHAAVPCTPCHAMNGAGPGKPHARCAACHDGSGAPGRGPAMTACAGCHPTVVGKPEPPGLIALHDTVDVAFSHARHARRGAAGATCTTCHAAIRTTDGTALPRPTTATCATCHDGRTAFAVTEACTRCHDRAPAAFSVDRPTARFSHRAHAAALAKRPCGACHPLAPGGEVLVAGHAACADAGCHAADFGQRHPTICGACHDATEPWRHLTATRALPETSEFGASLDHGKHAAACTTCHTLRTATAQLRPPRGHAACDAAGCHAVTGGPAPSLSACTSCHTEGLAAARRARRAADPWSVRAAFDHARHAASPCTACHSGLAGKGLLDLPTPAKSSCAPCHDGRTSFKLTGTACTRCHVGATR